MTQECRKDSSLVHAGNGSSRHDCCALADKRAAEAAPSVEILLVDDDVDCRMLIRDAIGVSNRVCEARSGGEALAYLKQCRESGRALPGLIYLDIEMPAPDGLETLGRIRADAAFAAIPVVMITGVRNPEQMGRAAKLGANSYTIKPTDPDQFLRTVRESVDYWMHIHQRPATALTQVGSDNGCCEGLRRVARRTNES